MNNYPASVVVDAVFRGVNAGTKILTDRDYFNLYAADALSASVQLTHLVQGFNPKKTP